MVQLNHVSGEGYIMPQIIPIKDLKNTGEHLERWPITSAKLQKIKDE